jgi:hypothetical protein
VINAIEDVSTGTTLGYMSNQQMNCDDCEFEATSTNDVENLVNLEHKVKELFSCKLCDFETEHGSELNNS